MHHLHVKQILHRSATDVDDAYVSLNVVSSSWYTIPYYDDCNIPCKGVNLPLSTATDDPKKFAVQMAPA